MGKLDGKTALVTGGGRGIGRGLVLEFAREGADVAINYRRDREAAEQTAAEARAFGRRALVVQADVGDREAVEKMVADSVAFLGALDIAVANSGVAARVATVAETDPAEWRRVLATDLDFLGRASIRRDDTGFWGFPREAACISDLLAIGRPARRGNVHGRMG